MNARSETNPAGLDRTDFAADLALIQVAVLFRELLAPDNLGVHLVDGLEKLRIFEN